jgi:carboxyl-terminal processing protease
MFPITPSVQRFLRLPLLFLVVLVIAPSAWSNAEEKRSEHLETFDAAWTIIDESHFEPNLQHVDLTAVRDEFRPRAAAARNIQDLRGVIEAMLETLGHSHMGLIPLETAETLSGGLEEADENGLAARNGSREGEPGFEFRLVNGEPLVTRVDPEGPAGKAGVKTGWIIKSVSGEQTSELLPASLPEVESHRAQYLAWNLIRAKLLGRPGTSVTIDFETADEARSVTLKRRREVGLPTKLGYLPPFYSHFEKELLRCEGSQVGLIRFNLWMIPVVSELDRAIDEYRAADGMILDLRGNLGGIGGMVLGVSGHFLNERVSLGTLRMRGNELSFFANPRRVDGAGRRVEPYAGPVAILIDGLSLSAAEIFAGGMQSIGRARLFGERSGGQALPAIWNKLPNGDVLYHAFGDFVTATGERLEGRGVIPDQTVSRTREDLLADRDTTLLAAMEWIKEQDRFEKSAEAERNATSSLQP